MEPKRKEAYLEEAKFQTRQVNKMKVWLKNLMIISSLIIMIIFFVKTLSPILSIIAYIVLTITIIAILLTGLAIRNGSMNVKNILFKIEH